jgi:hypothetical protein
LIFRIFCYLDAWGEGRGEDKTSFGSGLILLDFCIFCAIWKLHIAMVDRRGWDKTSFRIGLILFIFAV